MSGSGTAPLVSILIVARNTGPFIGAAITSAREQSFADLEIVVLDDGSTDDTRAVAARHAAEDERVRLLDGPQAGLVAVRNASLAAARGRWAAILDSDDTLHPNHVERLVEAARRTGAEIVAANMIVFHATPGGPAPSIFADGPEWRAERAIDLAAYVRANGLFTGTTALGYLKPLFDVDWLRAQGLGYDPRLRIGEDYDLVVRAIAAGARFRYLPRPSYFYRRHDGSTSHRLARKDLVGLIESANAGDSAEAPQSVRQALAERRKGLLVALAHHDAVEALKMRRPVAALRHLSSRPAAARLLLGSVWEGLGRRLRRLVHRRGGGAGIADAVADEQALLAQLTSRPG